MGSSQTTNNRIMIFDVEHEGWWVDAIAAASLLKTESSTYQDLFYHGDYTGKVHRDYNGTSDNGTAISSYFITRGYQADGCYGWLSMLRGIRAKMTTQSAGSMTVTYGASGATAATTALGTMAMTNSGYNYVHQEIYDPIVGTSFRFKFAQSIKDYTYTVHQVEAFVTPIRFVGVNY